MHEHFREAFRDGIGKDLNHEIFHHDLKDVALPDIHDARERSRLQRSFSWRTAVPISETTR
jgi:hypothetical protein